MLDTQIIEKAVKAIDATHALDPSKVWSGGAFTTSELLYARRMADMLEWFAPDASAEVKIAARCQHFKRWEIPRESYPRGKKGYYAWRKALYVYQAGEAAKLLKGVGLPPRMVSEIEMIINKSSIKSSLNARTVEDVACMVFLKHYALEFAEKHRSLNLKRILARTLEKMTLRAKTRLPELSIEAAVQAMVRPCQHCLSVEAFSKPYERAASF